jgi:hypothetical protein
MSFFRLFGWFVLGALVLAFWTVIHFGVRSSHAYELAVADYLSRHSDVDESDISLCFTCLARVGGGGGRAPRSSGGWVYYEFTLIVDRGDASEKVPVEGSYRSH